MLTIGIFAYNEELHLGPTVETVLDAAARAGSPPLEILIVNDGSRDRTEDVIADLRRRHPAVRSVTHPVNTGIGTAIRDIIAFAAGDRICFLPGDNIFTPYTLTQMLRCADKADVILHYHVNSEVRKRGRILLSVLFTFIYKFAFNLQLIYINCLGIYPTAALRAIPTRARRYNIAAEINVKMLRRGHSYYELASYMNPLARKSSALSLRNLLDVAGSFLRLWWEVCISDRAQYAKQPVRVIDSL